MKEKHLRIRIEQCLTLSKASGCPRRKFGAMLIDPERNVVLMDGYNGGPRGGAGHLCSPFFCLRNGVDPSQVTVVPDPDFPSAWLLKIYSKSSIGPPFRGTEQEAQAARDEYIANNQPVKSGTKMEIGCHHAEMNVICNAAASGVSTKDGLLIVTGEPCMMCAKMIHHAGITEVVCVGGGYIGLNGLDYLKLHKIKVRSVEGPQDPRLDE